MQKIAGAVAGFKNLFQGFVRGMAVRDVHGEELGAPEDAGDEVVEFMGDAAGELVQGVEFLIEQDLRFGLDLMGRRRFPGIGERLDFSGEIPVGCRGGVGVGGLHFE